MKPGCCARAYEQAAGWSDMHPDMALFAFKACHNYSAIQGLPNAADYSIVSLFFSL